MISIRRLVVRRGGFRLVIETLDVEDGEYLVVLGRSGAGKTTLLYAIAGFVDIEQGSIVVDGVDISSLPPERRGIAIVPQSYALFPHMRVYDNIAYGLRVRGLSRSEIEKRVREIARRLEIESLLDRYPAQLSGGEKQRVALARALVVEPKLLLLDEPFTNLDPETRKSARELVKELHRELGFTAIHATHMIVDAYAMASRVAYLERGRLVAVMDRHSFFRSPYARRYLEEYSDLIDVARELGV